MKHKLGLPLILRDNSVIYYSFNKNVLTLQTKEKVVARLKSLNNLITVDELELEACKNVEEVEMLLKGKASAVFKVF